jgi:catechol 2,3-dioxygenase-like lactoylglutathione lyase family enzyme
MFDHIGFAVKDVDASIKFYEAALAPLGMVCCSKYDGGAGFGPPGEPLLWLNLGQGGASHVAFRAKDHAAVQKFHAAALNAGGKDNGKPGPRADYSPTYYAAFILDPDGNNIEAVVR